MADGSSRSLDLGHELVVDLFAGGGGASLGIARAYRHPDVAVNHNPIAIAVHQANHPETLHYTCDVFEVDPVQATQGRPVAVLWASPDCRHHSKAKGGKPRSKKIRGLAWVVIRWASACKPRLICLENVEEFADWGPLDKRGMPRVDRKGATFRRWVHELQALGYAVEWRELIAADYGAPTIRKRLYIIARCDGRPIVWPTATHAKKPADGRKPWRSAAECIDWSLPANSIFGRKRPLADNTCRRIAKGLWRYVLTAAQPFVVPNPERGANRDVSARSKAYLTGAAAGNRSSFEGEPQPVAPRHETAGPCRSAPEEGIAAASAQDAAGVIAPFLTEHANASNQRVFAADEPLRTQVAQVKGGHFALVAPTLIQTGYGERPGQEPRALDLHAPLGTVVAEGVKHALVAAHVTHLTHHGGDRANDIGEPLRTVTGAHRGEQAVVAAYLSQASGGPNGHIAIGHDARSPVSTITGTGSHQQLVSAYLVKYYGNEREGVSFADPMHTVTTKDRLGVVQVVQVPAPALAPELLQRARECAAFLHRYLPDKFPEPADVVLVGDMVLVDITLRMLAPRELARAQGFGDDYELVVDVTIRTKRGKLVTRKTSKTDQVRLIGNSVCPDVAEALIRANAAELVALYARAA